MTPPELFDPPVSLRRRMPAAAAADPRGAITPGREVAEEADCGCDVPLAMAQTVGRDRGPSVRVFSEKRGSKMDYLGIIY